MRVLGGEYPPTKGSLSFSGKPVKLNSPQDALDSGIAVIHQEMVLAPDLSIAENIYLGELPLWVSRRAMQTNAASIIRRLGFDLNPAAEVGTLPVAHQQIVEIAKALSKNARVIVFDEPTAVLSEQDAQRMLSIIDDLRKTGVSVIYISHRLDEVLQIADRITVLKDGQSVATLDNREAEKATLSVDDLIPLMVGRPLSDLFGAPDNRKPGKEVLRVEGLSDNRRVKGFNLTVKAGEIVGLGGLVGAGRTEAVRLLFGAGPKSAGNVFLHGKPLKIRSPVDAVHAGIGLIPEDRKNHGTVLDFAISHNTTMARLDAVVVAGDIINHSREIGLVQQLANKLKLKCGAISDPVSSLSGGNQQKVVLAKWFHADCEVLIFDEPTRGVDVGAKAEIYTLIKYFAGLGRAVVVISSEHQELFGLCDRITVMREGEITGELLPPDYKEESLLKLAMVQGSAA